MYIIDFDFYKDMLFYYDFLFCYENGMMFKVFNVDELFFEKIFYLIGGGFIVDDEYFGEMV